jgi:hypothetical protein
MKVEDFNFPDASIPPPEEAGQSRIRPIRTCLAIVNLLNPPVENESGEVSSAESENSICDGCDLHVDESKDESHQNAMAAERREDAISINEREDASTIDITNDLKVDEDLEASDFDVADVDITTKDIKPQDDSPKRPYTPSFLSDTGSNGGHFEKRRKTSQGMSKSARASRALNEAFRSGKLEMSKSKVENWRQKCRSKDPDVEFDKNNIAARHSKCREFIKMKEPYDASRFNEHVKKCTPQTRKKKPAAGTPSLWRWIGKAGNDPSSSGSAQTQASALETEVNYYPCPGLTELDDSRIPKYLRRTGFAGGGARALTVIAEERFGKAFRELEEQKKQMVGDLQLHEHQWRNDHQGLRVFATKCKQRVPTPTLNRQARPCDECSALLLNKRFKSILHKPTPDDKDFIYTNRRYRSKNLGEIYARTVGLRQIIETPVCSCSSSTFSSMDAYLLLLCRIPKALHVSDMPKEC